MFRCGKHGRAEICRNNFALWAKYKTGANENFQEKNSSQKEDQVVWLSKNQERTHRILIPKTYQETNFLGTRWVNTMVKISLVDSNWDDLDERKVLVCCYSERVQHRSFGHYG